jgi:hypothetical protein
MTGAQSDSHDGGLGRNEPVVKTSIPEQSQPYPGGILKYHYSGMRGTLEKRGAYNMSCLQAVAHVLDFLICMCMHPPRQGIRRAIPKLHL